MPKRVVVKKTVKRLAKKTLGKSYKKAVLSKHFGAAVAANIKRRFPGRGLKVIGITGTSGKTSTAFLIHQMLFKAGYNVGLMTEVGYGLNDDIKIEKTDYTTPPIEITLNRIVTMKNQGLDWLIIEVTSVALDQFRVLGIPIEIAVMTNVYHEQLDYHGTFRKYVDAQLKLFKMANKNRHGRKLGVVNIDDDHGVLFVDEIQNVSAYSLTNKLDKRIACPHSLKVSPVSSSYTLRVEDDSYKIKCNLPGSDSVSNSLAAALVGRAIGLSQQQIEDGLAGLRSIASKTLAVDVGQNYNFIVDYSQSIASCRKNLKSLKHLSDSRLITVIGIDELDSKARRIEKTKVASRLSDVIIVYSPTQNSDLLEQISVVVDKIDKSLNKDIFLITNQEEAIKKATELAKKNDTVVLFEQADQSEEDPIEDLITDLIKRQLVKDKVNRRQKIVKAAVKKQKKGSTGKK